MHFSKIINAKISGENDRPMMQKELYPVSNQLQQYLADFKRDIVLPISYQELFHYSYSNAIKDENGKYTHWENVVYDEKYAEMLQPKILATYQLLKNSSAKNIKITAIDFCEFANSMPFRISVEDTGNNSSDYFYIKAADASRIYGLELEQLLSANNICYLYHKNTLVEDHIEGIPGDVFLKEAAAFPTDQKKLLATAFVTFNEECFTRLLGDMRSYNFVVVKTVDEQNPFKIKAIDFDQQCYEGKLNLYWPQFYKENYEYVQMANQFLGEERIESICLLARKKTANCRDQLLNQLNNLLQAMATEELSENYKVVSLRKELNHYFKTKQFSSCKTMGALLQQQLKQVLQ